MFSQSLLSLDLIEDFLARVNTEDGDGGGAVADYLDTWIPGTNTIIQHRVLPNTVLGKDYYRMDGSTSAETRKIWCKSFNKTTSHRLVK